MLKLLCGGAKATAGIFSSTPEFTMNLCIGKARKDPVHMSKQGVKQLG